jgi:hypothetical protein
MYFTFEISRPFHAKPFFFRSSVTIRAGWLWFAVGWHPMREDQHFIMVKKGLLTWGEAERWTDI